jgi:hypothetical protein
MTTGRINQVSCYEEKSPLKVDSLNFTFNFCIRRLPGSQIKKNFDFRLDRFPFCDALRLGLGRIILS